MAVMSGTMIEVGLRSFHDLGVEFLATVVFGSSTGQDNSVVCGVVDGNNDDDGFLLAPPQTRFYLDPFIDGDYKECAGSDWIVILLLVAIVHLVSWLPRYLLWEPLFRGYSRRMQLSSSGREEKKTTTREEDDDDEKCKRFSQACASLQLFATMAFLSWRIIVLPQILKRKKDDDWLFHRDAWIEKRYVVDADFKFFYLLYAARFVSDSVSLLAETRETEALVVAVLHHAVTIGLVLFSANAGLVRCGGVVMSFFDYTDIPLLMGKLCVYLSSDDDDRCWLRWSANRLFEFFALLFFLTRNVLYNYVVYTKITTRSADDDDDDDRVWVGHFLLVVLAGLQTYWMVLIVRTALRRNHNGGRLEDVREEQKKKKKA